MYKSRITKWGLDQKNNREPEARATVRKYLQAQRDGTQSTFEGTSKDPEHAARYLKRKGISIETILSSRPGSPSNPVRLAADTSSASLIPLDFSRALTTSPSLPQTLETPPIYRLPENLIHNIRTYLHGSLSSGFWILSGYSERFVVTRDNIARDDLGSFDDNITSCSLRSRAGLNRDAKKYLNNAYEDINSIVEYQPPYATPYLVRVIATLIHRGHHNLSSLICQRFAIQAAETHGRIHPFHLIFSLLSEMTPTHPRDIFLIALQAISDCFSSILGPFNWEVIWTTFDMTTISLKWYGPKIVYPHLQILSVACDKEAGETSPQAIAILVFLGQVLLQAKEWEDAESVGGKIVERADREERGWLRNIMAMNGCEGLRIVGHARLGAGDRRGARDAVEEALRRGTERLGEDKCLVRYRNILGELEDEG